MEIDPVFDQPNLDAWLGPFRSDRACVAAIVNLDRLAKELTRAEGNTLLGNLLTKTEQQIFHSFSFPKRKIEWLGGRLAAKNAATRLMDGGPLNNLEILTDANGRPYLGPGRKTDTFPDISISHSAGLAAAMAVDSGRCGIDIQKITLTVIKVREKFCTASEVEILENHARQSSALLYNNSLEARLTMLWTAKETLRKACAAKPLPGFMKLRLTNINSAQNDTSAGHVLLDFTGPDSEQTKVTVGLLGDFALAITVIT